MISISISKFHLSFILVTSLLTCDEILPVNKMAQSKVLASLVIQAIEAGEPWGRPLWLTQCLH